MTKHRRLLLSVLAYVAVALVLVVLLGVIGERQAHADPKPPGRLPTPSKVFGTDDRTRPPETNVPDNGYRTSEGELPWSRIAELTVKDPGVDELVDACTGWFAHPRIVLTAGHCLRGTGGALSEYVKLSPGRNKDKTGTPPVQIFGANLRTAAGFTGVNMATEFDWGGIILPDTSLSSQVGLFAPKPLSDIEISGKTWNVSGYPIDRPGTDENPNPDIPPNTLCKNEPVGNPMRAVLCSDLGLIDRIAPLLLEYKMDTEKNNSGSPVWLQDPNTGEYVAVGIHMGTGKISSPCIPNPVAPPNPDEYTNCGRRITQALLDEMESWVTQSVGGTAGLLSDAQSTADASASPGDYAAPIAAALAGAVVVLGAGGWYVRRRWLR